MYLTKADETNEIAFLASQLAPIVDRVGRLMSDFSP